MRSLFIRMMYMCEPVKSRTVAMLIAVILATISPLAFADDGTWSLDSAGSSARLYQGSAASPDSANTGVARVTGNVRSGGTHLVLRALCQLATFLTRLTTPC
jgi:hypothetical protein